MRENWSGPTLTNSPLRAHFSFDLQVHQALRIHLRDNRQNASRIAVLNTRALCHAADGLGNCSGWNRLLSAHLDTRRAIVGRQNARRRDQLYPGIGRERR